MLIPDFLNVRKSEKCAWTVDFNGRYIPEDYRGPHCSSESAKEALAEWVVKYNVILAVAAALERAGAEEMIAEVLNDEGIDLWDAEAVLDESGHDEAAGYCSAET